jgi:CRP-like cAMP-binding protein
MNCRRKLPRAASAACSGCEMNEHVFTPRQIIFRPGDAGDRAYLIREGSVELLRGSERLSLVTTRGPGEVFGEMSLIEDRPHTLTARAVGAVKAHGLTRDEFEKLLTTDPAMFRHYLKSLFERLRILSARAESAALSEADSEEAIEVGSDDLIVDGIEAIAENPTITIHPLTRRSAECLPDEGLTINKFPFRLGRASESRENDKLDLNDLWLLDREPFHVSRNHASINLVRGTVIVEDRGSKRGTYVNDVHLGARSPLTYAPLEDGDNVVILGGHSSPYQFRVHVSRS